jgi:predicted alpha/beta hydrolase family esterase
MFISPSTFQPFPTKPMPKVAIFCHGWNGHGSYLWFRKLIPLLEDRNVHCISPTFPDANDPRYPTWRDFLLSLIESSSPDADLYFVAHSMGGYLLLRFFADNCAAVWIQKCKGIVIVASPSTKRPEYKPFYDEEIGWDRLRTVVTPIVAIHSRDDDRVTGEHPRLIEEKLVGLETFKMVFVDGFGHFMGREVPDVIWETVRDVILGPE